MCGGPISWRSKKQTVVAKSTAESEFVALRLSDAACEAVFLRGLWKDIGFDVSGPTVLLTDNKAAQMIAEQDVFHHSDKMKHVDVSYFQVRHLVEDATVKVVHVSTHEQLADVLTKNLGRLKFKQFADRMVCSM